MAVSRSTVKELECNVVEGLVIICHRNLSKSGQLYANPFETWLDYFHKNAVFWPFNPIFGCRDAKWILNLLKKCHQNGRFSWRLKQKYNTFISCMRISQNLDSIFFFFWLALRFFSCPFPLLSPCSFILVVFFSSCSTFSRNKLGFKIG